MKKLLLCFGGLLFLPLADAAAGQNSPPSGILDEAASYQVAASVKLGIHTDKLSVTPKKGVSGATKTGGGGTDIIEACSSGYYYNTTTKKCEPNNVCQPNPCSGATPTCKTSSDGSTYSCLCTTTSCGAGKTCSGGTCANCVKGTSTGCNCPSGQVADGNGGCYTVSNKCSPNPCPATTPTCSPIGETDFSCACTSTSCGAGKKCNGMSCANCTSGEDCGCSASGKIADGSGGCKCPGIKVASGNGCACPSGYVSDGNNGCELEDKCANVDCASAKKCDPNSGDCVNCPLGEDCGCFDNDGYSSGDGVCRPNNYCSSNTDCDDSEYCNNNACEPVVCACNDADYFNCTIANHTFSCSCKTSTCQHDAYCWQAGQKCVYCGPAGTGVNPTTGECINISSDTIACFTQADCNIGEECMAGGTTSSYCRACGSGSLTKPFCRQGSSQGSSSASCSSSCPTGCSSCNSNCACTACETGYYQSGTSCLKKGTCSVTTPLHWRTMTCTSCDNTTGKCQGSQLQKYGTKGQDAACSMYTECETGWCLPGGTPGRSGNANVQGSHCS